MEFYAMTLDDVMIDSISVGFDTEAVPIENVNISFWRMSWAFYKTTTGEHSAKPPGGITFIRRKPTGAATQKPKPALAAKPIAAAVAAPPPPAATTFNSTAASLMRMRTRGQGTLILGKLDGVPGTSTQPGHLDETEFMSLQWATSTSGNSFDASLTVTPRNITVTKRCDKSTITLLTLCLTGKPMAKAVFMFVEPGSTPVEKMRLTLTNARVESLSTSAGKDHDMTELLSFSYDSVLLEQTAGGSKWSASWGKSNVPRK
jgi:type VI protein secretion system component Hcp